MVRGRDDWDLTHYMYLDKKAGQIRIPVDRARELFLQEVADGKLSIPASRRFRRRKSPPPAAPGAPGAAPAPGTPGATPVPLLRLL